jgi:hypothetical protein
MMDTIPRLQHTCPCRSSATGVQTEPHKSSVCHEDINHIASHVSFRMAPVSTIRRTCSAGQKDVICRGIRYPWCGDAQSKSRTFRRDDIRILFMTTQRGFLTGPFLSSCSLWWVLENQRCQRAGSGKHLFFPPETRAKLWWPIGSFDWEQYSCIKITWTQSVHEGRQVKIAEWVTSPKISIRRLLSHVSCHRSFVRLV